MTHGSLFSGIGGFDLAAEWSGFTNLFNCEWEEFPRKVLKHHFPNAEQYGDIHDFDATAYAGRLDILSGGFPCQPFSVAGKRKGSEDERHLWPEMLRIIRECQPRWIVGENVRGLVNWSDGLVFETCCTDLEALGYSVQSFIIPACAVNAPHRRDRVWIVAHSDNFGTSPRLGEIQSKNGEIPERTNNAQPSDTSSRNAPDTDSAPTKHTIQTGREVFTSSLREKRNASDTDNKRLQRGKERGGFAGSRDKREKQPTGRICTEWENFPTVPPVCGGVDGLPQELDGITFPKWRRESIKAYGNAIVPQVAHRIFESIKEYEEQPFLDSNL
jgi:DNA (cytosine-5)-methyltransferase 1